MSGFRWFSAAMLTCLAGITYFAWAQTPPPPAAPEPTNPKLANLPANEWVVLHQQTPTDKVRFKRQLHGGSCFDTKRCRIILFGSDTHDQDWANSPLIFDVVTGTWSQVYPNDDKSTYRTTPEGLPVAGVNGDHPWTSHTFGAVVYDPERDEMVVACWDEHMDPNGKFSKALKDVWPNVKIKPNWTFNLATEKWAPLAGEPQSFFPYACTYDSDRKVIVGYGKDGIWELGGPDRTWTRADPKRLTKFHNNLVYDSVNKAIVVYGAAQGSDEVIVYRPATKEHRKMPTPGVRPPKDEHVPMCFDPIAARTVIMADRGGIAYRPKDGKAETWLYDLAKDEWTQVPGAGFTFGCGMNYNMHYDPRHKVCLLVTEELSKPGWPVTVYAMRLDVSKIEKP
ncbi:MAG: hypothetical protein FWD53_08900 [Phycisphaerales bacterium]|nr:hypothetical protein [Phycisphaerales bacterium]